MKVCSRPWTGSLLNALTRMSRRSPMLGFSDAGSGTNSNFVPLHRAILKISLENVTSPALVASTFFVNAVANSTYASIRPIASILRPVYHHRDSSTLTILFLSTDLFPSVFSWIFYVGLHEIRVIRTRTSSRMIPSNQLSGSKENRPLTARRLSAHLFRILPWYRFYKERASKNRENDPHSNVRKRSFNVPHFL